MSTRSKRAAVEQFLSDCDVCKNHGIKSEAISYCETCDEYLCEACDKAHRGSKASRDHELVMWSKLPVVPKRKTPLAPSMLCDIHTTMSLSTFCKTHEDVICGNCQVTNHKECDTVDISEQAGKSDEAFSNTMKRLVRLKYKYEDLKEMRRADRATLTRVSEQCVGDMRKVREELNTVLDKLEARLIAEVREYEQTITREIDNHVNVADDMLFQIDNHIKEMKKFLKTRSDDVMFVGMTKTGLKAQEFEKLIGDIHNEIRTIDIQFQPGDSVMELISQLESIGTIHFPNKPYTQGQASLVNISIADKHTLDVGARDVRGCTFLPDGHFALACFTDGVKLFDKDFRFKSELYVPSADIAAYSDTAVIVTQRNLKLLQVLQVLPDMGVDRKIKVERICCGVDVFADDIYITCHDNPGKGEVQVLSKSGKIRRRLGRVDGKYMFERPLAVKISRDGTKIFVSDTDTNTVTCLDQQSRVVYRYSDEALSRPTGLHVDAVDNVLVCAWKSSNVHVVRQDGKQQMVLLNPSYGINSPLCVAYRQSTGVLVVGLHNKANTKEALVVIQTQ